MQYCCAECQESDAPLHNTICTSFANFQERPSPYHYRAILFDAYEVRPRFIWLLIDGMRGIQDVNKDDWSRYCSGRRSSDITITTDQGFTPPRQFNHRILVEYDEDSLGRGLPANLCLIKLCGPEVARFRGNYIARGYKYRGDTTPDQRDPCDIYIPGGCDIALDLDTTCLDQQESQYLSGVADFVARDHTSPASLENSTENVTNASSKRRTGPYDISVNTNVPGSDPAVPAVDETEQAEAASNQPVSWSSLPRKDQLLVLVLARLSEPLTQTSLGSYLYYQLQSFNPSLPESTISYQAGIIGATFPATQFLTAMLWGRFSDSEYGGRKRTIYLGLVGTMLSTIGFGFSNSFAMAVFFRCLGGILNGNIGVMRTMISEIIKEKKFQSRAFLLMPMTFNVGVLIGPVLGGVLADPVASYPGLFGPGSAFGGKDGVQWMMKYPYALPNLVSAMFLCLSSFAVLFFLEETGEACKDRPDFGLRMGRWILRTVFRRDVAPEPGYNIIPSDDLELQQTPTSPHVHSAAGLDKPSKHNRQKLPFRRIWTRNLIVTLCAHGALAMHVGTFNGLWTLHLSTPRFDPAHPHPPNFTPHGLFFTGGLAMPPARIGLALAIIGVIGLPLQLLVYPRISHKLGTTRCFRTFLALFPLMYTLVPFLSLVPSWTPPPHGAGAHVCAALYGYSYQQCESASVGVGDRAWNWAVGFESYADVWAGVFQLVVWKRAR
ncbi:uncharacterized protein yc1106_06849 [Curvularia clavata]|uniref:Major facilitator superfamily (MFS) profile domain-containing protein n=1 Tax=Curvularia clavata TaxID=95742 RepID=A0A9Q8ZC91_CURCL|nr:uncharacterized protein yc1106_06849 [Curvularia clavata]